jgi:hypothetical protein
LSEMDAIKALMGDFEGLDQFQIRAIGHIDETDVVVLSINAAGARLIGPLEPVGSDHLRKSKGVFDIVAVSDSALLLIADLNEARSQPPCRRTEVEFSDEDGLAGKVRDASDTIGFDFEVVDIDAVHVESTGSADLRIGRAAAGAHPKVEVVGIIFPDGIARHLDVKFERAVDKFLPPLRRVSSGQPTLELALRGCVAALEDELGRLLFLLRKRRFVCEEVAEEPRIVLARCALAPGGFVGVSDEFIRIDIRQAQVVDCSNRFEL